MAVEILMPRLTDTMHEGMISYWYKTEEEAVQQGEPLFVVETDKASVEVDASSTGILLKILVQEGESAAVGHRIAIIGERGEDIQALLTVKESIDDMGMEFTLNKEQDTLPKVVASPAAKRKAKEHNIDLKKLTGTGEGGLITLKDVIGYLEQDGHVSVPLREYGLEERIPLQGIQKAMAERMAATVNIPQVTTVAETDVSELLKLSREISVTITSFVVRAVIDGLTLYPLINASLDGQEILLKKYYNIGVSVSTPQGLVVPVLHNVEGKDVYHISKHLAELAQKARQSHLGLEDISGGTFTVTNSGVFGSLFFTPRINPPQSAILGMGKFMKQPVVVNDDITIRSMMYLSISYDHRIIDGETAVKFLQEVKKTLESPQNLI